MAYPFTDVVHPAAEFYFSAIPQRNIQTKKIAYSSCRICSTLQNPKCISPLTSALRTRASRLDFFTMVVSPRAAQLKSDLADDLEHRYSTMRNYIRYSNRRLSYKDASRFYHPRFEDLAKQYSLPKPGSAKARRLIQKLQMPPMLYELYCAKPDTGIMPQVQNISEFASKLDIVTPKLKLIAEVLAEGVNGSGDQFPLSSEWKARAQCLLKRRWSTVKDLDDTINEIDIVMKMNFWVKGKPMNPMVWRHVNVKRNFLRKIMRQPASIHDDNCTLDVQGRDKSQNYGEFLGLCWAGPERGFVALAEAGSSDVEKLCDAAGSSFTAG